MDSLLERTLAIADELLRRERDGEEQPALSPEAVIEAVDLELPRCGLAQEEVLDRLRTVMALSPRTSGPRFYNQLFAGREPLAGAAEMLASLLNTSMYTYKVAGLHVLIEQQVVARMARLAGYEDGEGTTVPGGSLGNLVALVMARNEAFPELRDQGGGGAQMRVYTSQDGHYSVRKGAGIVGIGRNNVRQVAVDDDGRMDPSALARMIEEDRRAGLVPACIVATAGTTVLGAFDPLREIATVAREHGVWLHVDGALGATLLLHPEHRRKLDGVGLSDSLCWNAHKMMGVPLPSAFLLVRRAGLLHRHFNEAADYLFQQDDADLNLGTKSIQCGRRNDVLKVWAAWQALGDDGWARRIERQLALAGHAAEVIAGRQDLVLTRSPESVCVCFEVKGRSSRQICERLHRSGAASVGYGVVQGRSIIRLVTVNPEVTFADLDRFFDNVERIAADLPQTETAAESFR